jgi:hypothetical protein
MKGYGDTGIRGHGDTGMRGSRKSEASRKSQDGGCARCAREAKESELGGQGKVAFRDGADGGYDLVGRQGEGVEEGF